MKNYLFTRTYKMKVIRFVLLETLIIAMFLSCSNLDSSTANVVNDKKAYISACVDDNSYAARSVMPENLELSDLDKFTLVGVDSANVNKTFGEWNNYSAMTGAYLLCDLGVWNFTLYAYRNGTLIFYSTITKTISEGYNTLNFSMIDSSEPGTVSVTLYFPADEQVRAVKAGLFSLDGGETAGFGLVFLVIKSDENDSEKVFAEYRAMNVPVGYYFVKFYFYRDAECTDQIQTPYTELVNVAGGRTSEATREIQSVEHIYTITYELNGGTNSAENPQSYIVEYLPITLAEPTRSGCVFAGWYTNSSFTTSISQIESGSFGDITLYAKWNDTLGISASVFASYTDIPDIICSLVDSTLTFSAPSGYSKYMWYWNSKKLSCTETILQIELFDDFVKGGHHIVFLMIEDFDGMLYSAQYQVAVTK